MDRPSEQVYELGNAQTVATVYDTPNLSFDLESLDVSTEVEALLTGEDPTATVDGDLFNFNEHMPIDVISPFKTGLANFAIIRGVVIPYLTLEQVTYRFGLRANATQSYTLRSDSVFYVPGTPYYQEFTLIDNTLTYTLTNTAVVYNDGDDAKYVLSACVKNETTKTYRRLFFGADYTNSSTQITLLQDWFDEGYTTLHVTYGSATAATYNQSVHQGTNVKPAAVRSKDIDVYVEDLRLATPALGRWTSVQSIEATRRVTLDPDEEFGNAFYVAQDYDVPEVSGSVVIKAQTPQELHDKISQVTNVPANEVIGPLTSPEMELEIRIDDPDTGDVLKTLYVPDAQFTIPGTDGRVQSKLESTFPWTSASGTLEVYAGARP